MNPLESYLRDLHLIRSTGANLPETSFYGPLQNLLNEIGKSLKPKVRCVMGLRDRGAGFPDGGLFTPDQFQRSSPEPLRGTGSFSALGEGACPRIAAEGGQAPRSTTNGEPVPLPSRGVIEVKPTGDDAWATANGTQVTRYWGTYRSVLVTNYRDFVLVARDAEGRPAKLESYRLAASEGDFWAAAAHPRKMADAHGERFIEYLKRVLLHAVPLASPQALAWFLASYARDASCHAERASETRNLHQRPGRSCPPVPCARRVSDLRHPVRSGTLLTVRLGEVLKADTQPCWGPSPAKEAEWTASRDR